MSIKAIGWAAGIRTGKASYKSVLVALANFHHKKNDTCFASIQGLVDFTELNWKTVTAAIDHLEKAGLISTIRSPGKATQFILDMDQTTSKIGGGRKQGSGKITPSKSGGTPPPKLVGVGTPSKTGGGPPPKTEVTPSNIGGQTGINGNITGITPYSPPEEKPKKIADRVIEALNIRSGKKYKLIDGNRKHILARLKDGHSEQDLLKVIDTKCMQWIGTDMEQYLRPDTLFRPSKFEGYLNDNRPTRHQPATGSTSTRHRSIQEDLQDTDWASGVIHEQ